MSRDAARLMCMRPARILRCLILLILAIALISIFLIYTVLVQLPDEIDEAEFVSASDAKTTVDVEHSPCFPTVAEVAEYPNCLEKLRWLAGGWQSHSCYAMHGVDGSVCSFRRYLSGVERHCPPLPGHDRLQVAATLHIAQPNLNLEDLLGKLTDKPENYDFIRGRIGRLWPQWKDALASNQKKHPHAFANRTRMTILLHLGFLSNTKFGSISSKGGPLGELVQWSDLLASLHLLGHRLIISTEAKTLLSNIDGLGPEVPCPGGGKGVDLVFIDIMGLRALKKRKAFLDKNRCKFRMLDSFGTHAQFNSRPYYSKHVAELGGKKNPWGGHAFNLRQFWTLYPHTHDNTFLGFVVATGNQSRQSEPRSGVLIYGKEKYMWEKATDVVKTALTMTEVHATVGDAASADALPAGVVNHGFLDETAFHALLSRVSAFVGLGFPFEGPAPLEAIAHGAVFINPAFEPPKGRLTDAFFAEKPTLRALSSQCPYLEEIGPPWVLTLNTSDESALRDALHTALQAKIEPLIPYELTAEGMLLRVAVLAAQLDTCSALPAWPPLSALREEVGEEGSDCEETCKAAGLRCEPSFFPLLNRAEQLRLLLGCSGDSPSSPSVVAPSRCVLQEDALLYSCSASLPGSVRLCPCRDTLPFQQALCSDCIR